MMKTNPTQPHTILWADDDADDRQVICEIVSAYSDKYHVLEVEDGSEVLSYLHAIKDKQKLPCLVVLDINMPKLNGTETLASIKRDERYKDLTVAVFTTSNSALDRKICERYGAPMLTKPSSYEDFREAVAELLQMCRIDGFSPPEAN
ncbi:response regulator [Flavisolibacter sp. BT320]|nr:response regulator [Flavisolibacter longurius]